MGELGGLKTERVDLMRSRITVAETIVEVHGNIEWHPPKTQAGRRTLTLPRPVADELDAHIRQYVSGELIFPSPTGFVLRPASWRARFWNPATKLAGLEGLTPHDMRHTAVALWIAAGANLVEVKKRAGHTKASFTLDRYGHLFPEADEALSDRLAGLYVARDRGKSAEIRPFVERAVPNLCPDDVAESS